MPLDSLLELVETLKQRIVKHKAALSQSEALDKVCLDRSVLKRSSAGTPRRSQRCCIPEYRIPNGMGWLTTLFWSRANLQ